MFLAKQGRAPYPAGAEGNHMIADIQQIEIAGEFWVGVVLDGHQMERHGPFSTVDAAEDLAGRLAAACRVPNAEVHTANHNG